MDRFNANRIFERLREVNTLANIQLQKENKKVLRFFYLLRDDIFVSKDRTKFFDYIMPVVPVVDGSNSYDQFISHFKKSGFFEKFDESFLQGLSLYIDDMRLLKNIYNEFVIYFNRLNITESPAEQIRRRPWIPEHPVLCGRGLFRDQLSKAGVPGDDAIRGGLQRIRCDCQRPVPAGQGVFLHGAAAGFYLSCL